MKEEREGKRNGREEGGRKKEGRENIHEFFYVV